MRSKIPWPATYPCFTYVEIGRRPKDHHSQTWTFQRTFRAHPTVASSPPPVPSRCGVSQKQEKPSRLRELLCYQFVIEKWCRRSVSNWHGVTPTGFWVGSRAYQLVHLALFSSTVRAYNAPMRSLWPKETLALLSTFLSMNWQAFLAPAQANSRAWVSTMDSVARN